MNLFNPKTISKFLVFSSILIVAILLFISIINNYVSHTYYSKFQRHLKEGRQGLDLQIQALRHAFELCPANAKILFELGRFYIKEELTGKNKEDKGKLYEQAKEFFLEALMRKPTDGRHWAEYAWYISRFRETNEVIEHFTKAVNLGMNDAYVHSIYARWCVNQVKKEIDIEDSLQFIEMCKKGQISEEIMQSYDSRFIDNVSIATFLRQARMEWNKALFLVGGTRAFRNRTTYNSLGDLNLLSCEIDKAIKNYNRANNKIMSTRCYIIKGDYGRAFRILRSIFKKGGSSLQGNLVKKERLLIEFIKKDPMNYESFYWLGEIYNRRGMIEKAIVNFKRVIELNPKHIDSHLKLAKLYNSIEKPDLAVEECEMVLSLNPKNKDAIDLLSEMIRGGFIKKDPKNYESFYWLGEIYNRLGLIEKAIVNFKKVIELNPEHIDSHLKLAKLYNSTEKTDLAIKECEMVLSLNPKNKDAIDLLSELIRGKYKDFELMRK